MPTTPRSRKSSISAFARVAISDWFHPPKVEAINLASYRGRAGDVITAHATDPFGVGRVHVTLADAHGKPFESGEAVLSRRLWRYTTTKAAPAARPSRSPSPLTTAQTDRVSGA